MKALGGRGMYPWLLRFPDRHLLRVGAGAGVSVGGKRMMVDDDEAVLDRSDVGGESSDQTM